MDLLLIVFTTIGPTASFRTPWISGQESWAEENSLSQVSCREDIIISSSAFKVGRAEWAWTAFLRSVR